MLSKTILEQIEEKLNSGYKKIILCAPTGVGKSLVGATTAKHFDSSFTVTASKHLQDQYIKDIPFLKPVTSVPVIILTPKLSALFAKP